ncbi:YlaC family protein [Mangrovibacter sp. SLW1]
MTEIQRLLSNTIEQLNHSEKRDNHPRFSISFIRRYPGLFVAMYAGWLATLVVVVKSTTLQDFVWLHVALFVLLNGFFFFDVNPRYRYQDIDLLDFRVCYNGEWYNTRAVPEELISDIQASSHVSHQQKDLLAKMLVNKKMLTFYDIYSLDKQAS